MITADMWH